MRLFTTRPPRVGIYEIVRGTMQLKKKSHSVVRC